MYQNKFTIKSFFKLTPILNNYILKCVKDNKIITVKQVQKSVSKELNVRISTQFIYNLLKKNNYVYKKFKYNNNPYKIEEQVDQFKNVSIVIKQDFRKIPSSYFIYHNTKKTKFLF